MIKGFSRAPLCAAMLLVLQSSNGFSASCDAKGGLLFVGVTNDRSRSVWLSGTGAGNFFLQASKGQQVVDTWQKSRKGLHLSLSPDVSNGNGNPHTLYNGIAPGNAGASQCQLDKINQAGGVILPPITFPPAKPPVEVKPPIATLPPTGITPELPAGVKPPIGTLPPTGVMPSLPGVVTVTPELPAGVRPPIGSLPPTGVMPSLPGVVTVTPELPAGVKPPIGTLPPTGVMPSLPGVVTVTPELPAGVKPPIGTLPPTGVMPSLPGVVTVTPELPAGVKPPIGTLPPTGVMPSLPGVVTVTPELPAGVKPPIGTLPPTGITPELPTVTKPDRPGLGNDGPLNVASRPEVDMSQDPCRGVFEYESETGTRMSADMYGCKDMTLSQRAETAPLSKGRDLVAASRWNLWMDVSHNQINDSRHNRDVDGSTNIAAFGMDTLLSENVIAGASLQLEQSESDGFGSAWETQARGLSVRPYLAFRLDNNWSTTAMLGVGWFESEQSIVVLNGEQDQLRYSLDLSTAGQYLFGDYVYRPQINIFYGVNELDSYNLTGNIFDRDLSLPIDAGVSRSGTVSVINELSTMMISSNGTQWVPFGTIGVDYDYKQANNGELLGADLKRFDTSPWRGSLQGGVRVLASPSLQFEISAAYLSLGQSDLDSWNGRFYLSYAF